MPRSSRAGRLVALLAVAALALSACAPEASVEVELPTQVEGALPDDVQAELRAAVETAMAASGSTGAIVDIRAPWAGTWSEGLGTTAPGGAPVEVGMPFKAGPVTRTMTCDVLYGLADSGVVALDDLLTDWLSGYPTAGDVTLEQLCNGTSGLSSYSGQLLRRWLDNPERAWIAKELAAYGYARGFAFEPGTAYRDADTGYILLGLALERASGKTAAMLFDEYVFEPLDMQASALPASASGSDDWLHGLRSANDAEGEVDCAAPQDVTTAVADRGGHGRRPRLDRRRSEPLRAGPGRRRALLRHRGSFRRPDSGLGEVPLLVHRDGRRLPGRLPGRAGRLVPGVPHRRVRRPRDRDVDRRGAEQLAGLEQRRAGAGVAARRDHVAGARGGRGDGPAGRVCRGRRRRTVSRSSAPPSARFRERPFGVGGHFRRRRARVPRGRGRPRVPPLPADGSAGHGHAAARVLRRDPAADRASTLARSRARRLVRGGALRSRARRDERTVLPVARTAAARCRGHHRGARSAHPLDHREQAGIGVAVGRARLRRCRGARRRRLGAARSARCRVRARRRGRVGPGTSSLRPVSGPRSLDSTVWRWR